MVWALLTPLLTLLVYTVGFHVVFHATWYRSDENFMVYAMNMFSGIIAFGIFSESAIRARLVLIVQNANFVKKAVFPLELLPVSVIAGSDGSLGSGVGHLSSSALCGAGPLHWTLIFLPIVVLPLMIFTMGVCWILSSLGVFFGTLEMWCRWSCSFFFLPRLSPIL